jgi:hypothetical protein
MVIYSEQLFDLQAACRLLNKICKKKQISYIVHQYSLRVHIITYQSEKLQCRQNNVYYLLSLFLWGPAIARNNQYKTQENREIYICKRDKVDPVFNLLSTMP